MTTNVEDPCLPYEVSMRDLIEAREAMIQRGKLLSSAPQTNEPNPDLLLLNKFLCEIAVIKYARPFKASNWASGKFRISSDELVPTLNRALHNDLIALRDQVIAHSDGATQKPFNVLSIETKLIGTTLEAQILLHHKAGEFMDLINTVHQKLTEKTQQLHSSE